MILPLFYSLLKIISYLTNKNLKKRKAHIFLSIVGMIVSSFLIFIIASAFWFNKLKDMPQFLKGTVFAIEPMITLGCSENRLLNDYWTIVTKDGSPCAHFEHTVAITSKGPEVLTCGPNGEGWAM